MEDQFCARVWTEALPKLMMYVLFEYSLPVLPPYMISQPRLELQAVWKSVRLLGREACSAAERVDWCFQPSKGATRSSNTVQCIKIIMVAVLFAAGLQSWTVLFGNKIEYAIYTSPFIINMNRHCQKEELQKNAEAVHRLYAEVLSSLVDRLLKENRFRKSIAEEDIMKLQQSVRDRLGKDKTTLFLPFLQMKESTKIELAQAKPETVRTKIEANEENNETAQLKTEPSKSIVEDEEEYVDDLAEFDLPKEGKTEAVQAVQAKSEQQVKEQLQESGESASEGYNSAIEDKIGSAVLGCFCSFQIKRKPKEEKIFIELENVFLKSGSSPLETYFGRVSCELTKIEKEDIRDIKK